jgi:CRP-like cAMP-binding protein
VAFAAEPRVLRSGDVLFRKGDRADGGYVVKFGAIALAQRDDGVPAFVAGPSAVIGQTALFARVTRPATATARELSTVLRVSSGLMRRVLEEFPAAAEAMRDVIEDELAELTRGLNGVRQRLLAIEGEG